MIVCTLRSAIFSIERYEFPNIYGERGDTTRVLYGDRWRRVFMDDDLIRPECAQAAQIYRKYRSLVYSIIYERVRCCRSEQAEDIAEQVFLRMCSSLKRGSGPVISEKQWLSRIVENECIRFKQKRRDIISLDRPITQDEEEVLADLLRDDDASTEEIAEREESFQALYRACYKLPPHLQEVIRLHYFKGWTLTQISKHIGLSLSTVIRRRDKAIYQLHEHLIEEQEE